jgi:hypothetical protein
MMVELVLNVKTAKAMAEELELILILGFGIIQKTSMEIKDKKTEENKIIQAEGWDKTLEHTERT